MTTVGGDMVWGDPCNSNEFRETGSIFVWHMIKDHLCTLLILTVGGASVRGEP